MVLESKWDLVFAVKTDIINRHIISNGIPLIKEFSYKHEAGTLSGSIPTFQIGWAGNEQYMELNITLRNVCISYSGISEKYDKIQSIVHMQYAFKDNENVGFICKTIASRRGDSAPGAIWVENADVNGTIKDQLTQNVFSSLLGKALIQNEQNISFVIANLNTHFFEPIGINIEKRVPAFQRLGNENVMAVMCMTTKVSPEPSRQFSPELLSGFDYGYILRREVFINQMLFPNIRSLINIDSGNFKISGEDAIINNGTIYIKSIKIAATHYQMKADLLKLQFAGDILHLHMNGKTDFTGLTDSYITYSFHAKRKPVFSGGETQKVVFEKIAGCNDEFHSDKYIPLWIEIISGIFTFGLFNLISGIFSSEIQDRTGSMFNNINFNGNNEGYAVKWANLSLKFTDGSLLHDFYMRGK